jgi:hypothetical protein
MSESAPGCPVELVLPSGRRITARRPHPAFLGLLASSLNSLKSVRGEDPSQGVTDEQATDLAWAIGEVVRCCFVEPRLSLDPKLPGEIHPRDISTEDVLYVARWAWPKPEERVPQVTRPVRGKHKHRQRGG